MEATQIELVKPHRRTKHNIFLALTALTIITVAVTTALSSTASTPRQEVATQAGSAQPLQTATVANPDIEVDCERPVLTIAIQIDRSGSVWGRQGQYIATVNQFIRDLHDQFVIPGGQVNLIVFAFGTKSVLQNNAVSTPLGQQLVTEITDGASRDKMIDAVNQVYFSDTLTGAGYFSRSNSAYDRARGYNPANNGSPGSYWGYTNWDDALLDFARIGSSSYYNNPEIGRHIDLALLLTDGSPNVNNGPNRVLGSDDLNGGSAEIESVANRQEGIQYSRQTVTALRQGTAIPGTGIPARPPMAVRGVLIAHSTEQPMQTAFGLGSDNYLLASNFGAALKEQLNVIVNSLTEGICALEVVTPSISVSVNPSNVTLVEEGPARTIQVTVSNTSAVPVSSVVVRFNGQARTIASIAPNTSSTVSFLISLPLGGTVQPSFQITAEGIARPTSTQRFGDGSTERPVNGSDGLTTSMVRIALPA